MSLVVSLKGGMGNQMYQYAMARSNAIRLGTDVVVDVATFRWYRLHPYTLDQWAGVKYTEISGGGGNEIRETVEGGPYNPALVASIQDGCRLNGYWVTDKYFADIADTLRQEFVPKTVTPHGQEIAQQIAETPNSVFMGIRRGDHVGTTMGLPMEYFPTAANVVAKQRPDPHFFVFSDESQWVKDTFRLPYPMTVVSSHEVDVKDGLEAEDIWLMSRCNHGVISLSSFSWWGAWLNPNADKTVVAPYAWIRDHGNPDVYPGGWTTI